MMAMSERPLRVETTCTCSVTSWYISRSPVTRYISHSASSPRRASVPRISSPSQPSSSITGIERFFSSSLIMGNWLRRFGSMGGRWALYWGSISMRTFGRPLSNAQTTPSGENSSTILRNMLRKPNTALVGRPSGAFMVGGTAWKARCMSELPSMTAMTRRARAGVKSGMEDLSRPFSLANQSTPPPGQVGAGR